MKFWQNSKQSKRVNHEAKDTSRDEAKKISQYIGDLSITNNFELADV